MKLQVKDSGAWRNVLNFDAARAEDVEAAAAALLREPQHRLRKAGAELLKDGSIAKNPQRMGPITLEARLMGLERVLGIQAEINTAARRLGRPEIDLINAEEEARIRDLIAVGTWPQGWEGDEPIATTVMDVVYQNGAVQPLLFSE